MSSPESFGFLSANPAGVSVLGSTLAVAEGETLAVIGGEITLISGSLSAPSGQLHLTSVAAATFGFGDAGAIVLDAGELSLMGGGGINSSSIFNGAAGDISITAQTELSVTDGSVIAASTRNGPGGNVSISASTLALDGTGSNIQAQTIGNGTAGDIIIKADRLTITGAAGVSSTSGFVDPLTNTVLMGSGTAGNISMTTTDIDIKTGQIMASTIGEGRAGDITIEAERLTLTEGAGITSVSGFINPTDGTLLKGSGAAGDIVVKATEMQLEHGCYRQCWHNLYHDAQLDYG